MTERYFGFDWSTVLPWEFDGFSAELSTPQEVVDFFQGNVEVLFGAPNRHFLNEPMTAAKLRFADEMDTIVLRQEGEIVGCLMGHPTDWSSYYARSFSIMPTARNARMATEFGKRFLAEIVEHTEVRRFEVDTSIGNPAMARMLITLGFIPTMTVTSERWGLMTRYTKFLDTEARTAFSRQFVNAPELGQEIRGERT